MFQNILDLHHILNVIPEPVIFGGLPLRHVDHANLADAYPSGAEVVKSNA
jgi:hypothetical protein